ncbi:methionine ABC transporter ATP-binding protein [Pseudonocardia sp. EC080610-09]|uniref:methionine ABC transporter ATP-binding protein n=1 Tax=unclassified Pseudonocardia TaxID=2619320 RepID=UPI0006CB339D|nr:MULTISPECIES: methionine ABC transporter ATP-binding protein [unclassified Pseudonocardia]ALE72845.1 methionine ABC transporter ATP-binding protein [Pseudonocardia sp. EC080625-04]ALL76170.1 methionine ABC transporter ATP-binding protein [Pseudonocardia sp. EC080610-09]ALL83195.1 methionine ABC transporter ATP-binding protein [Pseudonocardia sp. EC080619-01]
MGTPAPPAVISFSGATRTFPARRGPGVTAVDGVDLDVAEGGITGVIGWSGAGKSTLVRMINALELPTSGTVTVRGRVTSELSERGLRELRGEVGMIFQQFALLQSRTVAGNVGYPLRVAGWSREARRERVAELLEFVGLSDLAGRYPARLSGGQKQRVGIARALATSPSILLADEATSALDPETTREVLALLRRVNAELGTTVVVITHEMEVAAAICDRVVVMEDGAVIEHGDVYDVFAVPSHPATKRFVHGVLQDVPSADTVQRLRERHPGRLVTVAVGGTGTGAADAQDAVARIPAEHGVRSTVVHGGIRELAGRPVGSLTLELTGADAAVQACVDELSRAARVTELSVNSQEPSA